MVRKQLVALCLHTLLVSLLLSCEKEATPDTDDGNTLDLASSISSVGEQAFVAVATRGECKAEAFTDCNGITKTQTRFFSAQGGDTSPCTRGKDNAISTYGSSTLTYSNGACTFTAAADTVTRTIDMYEQRGSDGRKVLFYSRIGNLAGVEITDDNLKDYDGVTRQGGGKLTFQSEAAGVQTYNLVVTGNHRESLLASGKRGHHHITFTSAAGMTVTRDVGAGSYTLNGTMFLVDKRKNMTYKKTYTGVTFVPPCRHPQSGTVKFDQVGTQQTFTVEFNPATCGAANVGNVALDLENSES